MGIDDNPSGANDFRYIIGWDLDEYGKASAGWRDNTTIPGIGYSTGGGGVAIISKPLIKAKLDQPKLGTNEIINVTLNKATTFKVAVDSSDHKITETYWKLVSGTTTVEDGSVAGSERNLTFRDPGDYTLYCTMVRTLFGISPHLDRG